MSRKFVALLLFSVLLGLAFAVHAEPKNKQEAKAELERLDKVKAVSKDSVIPLINCFIQHQQYLQNMYGDYPERGREHITALDYCTTRYAKDAPGEGKLNAIKNKIVGLTRQAKNTGASLCDAYSEFNKLSEKMAVAKKPAVKEDLQRRMDAQKKVIESHKADMSRIGNEFAKLRQEYLAWQKEFVEYYKKIRKMAK